MWVVRVGGDDGELRPWHYIYVYSIESSGIRLLAQVRVPGLLSMFYGLGVHVAVFMFEGSRYEVARRWYAASG